MAIKHRIKTAIILAKLAGYTLGNRDEDDKGEYRMVRAPFEEDVMQSRRQRKETITAWTERLWHTVGERYIKIDWNSVMFAVQAIHEKGEFEVAANSKKIRLYDIEKMEWAVEVDIVVPNERLRDSMTMIAYLAVLEYYYTNVFKLTEDDE